MDIFNSSIFYLASWVNKGKLNTSRSWVKWINTMVSLEKIPLFKISTFKTTRSVILPSTQLQLLKWETPPLQITISIIFPQNFPTFNRLFYLLVYSRDFVFYTAICLVHPNLWIHGIFKNLLQIYSVSVVIHKDLISILFCIFGMKWINKVLLQR